MKMKEVKDNKFNVKYWDEDEVGRKSNQYFEFFFV